LLGSWLLLPVFFHPSLQAGKAGDGPPKKMFSKDQKSEQIGKVLEVELSDFNALQDKAYLGNLYRNGVYTTKGLPSLKGVKWSFKAGGGIRSSPVVVDGVVYIGCDDGNLYALNAKDGSLKWKFDTGGMVRGSAEVCDGVVYVGSVSKKVYAIGAKDGKMLWEHETKGLINKTPTVARGLVCVGDGPKILEKCEEWQYGPSGTVIALRASDGKLVWESSFGAQGLTALSCDGEFFYANESYNLKNGSSNKTGEALKKTIDVGSGGVWTAASVDGDKCYASCLYSGVISAVSKEGKELWSRSHNKINEKLNYKYGGDAGTGIPGGLTLTEKLLIYGVEDGHVYGMNKENGDIVWSFQSGKGMIVYGTPVVAGGLVYVGTLGINGGGDVIALKVDDGKLVWKHPAGKQIWGTVWPGDGVVYFACVDGTVCALE